MPPANDDLSPGSDDSPPTRRPLLRRRPPPSNLLDTESDNDNQSDKQSDADDCVSAGDLLVSLVGSSTHEDGSDEEMSNRNEGGSQPASPPPRLTYDNNLSHIIHTGISDDYRTVPAHDQANSTRFASSDMATERPQTALAERHPGTMMEWRSSIDEQDHGEVDDEEDDDEDVDVEVEVDDTALAVQSHGYGSDVKLCTCQPEARIPRPRNAFILYRQSRQKDIVAGNPGIANPEISKIIGVQWHEEDAKVKLEFKRMAEQEKYHHQQRYPLYRYQPRRTRKAAERSVLHNDRMVCTKCGGVTGPAPAPQYNNGLAGLNTSARPRSLVGSSDTLTNQAVTGFRQYDDRDRQPHQRQEHVSGYGSGPWRQSNDRDTAASGASRGRHGQYPRSLPTLEPANPGNYGSGSFPYSQQQQPVQPYPQYPHYTYAPGPPSPTHSNLPGIHSVANMAAPPSSAQRPLPEFRKSPSSQPPDPYEALRLPPIRAATGSSKTTGSASTFATIPHPSDTTDHYDYCQQITHLASLSPKDESSRNYRGPLIAVESNNSELALQVGRDLLYHLPREYAWLDVSTFAGKEVDHTPDTKDQIMARAHTISAYWLSGQHYILDWLCGKHGATTTAQSDDVSMEDAHSSSPGPQSWKSSQPPRPKGKGKDKASAIEVKSTASDEEGGRRYGYEPSQGHHELKPVVQRGVSRSPSTQNAAPASDKSSKPSGSSASSSTARRTTKASDHSRVPVALVYNYSVYASRVLARLMPNDNPNQVHAVNENWLVTARMWQGILKPDVTVYVQHDPKNTLGREGDGIKMWPQDDGSEIKILIVTNRDPNPEARLKPPLDVSVFRRLMFEISDLARNFIKELH